MKRIGVAASKMSKGNLALYNSYVVLIAFLFSVFIFIIAGAAAVFALVVISYLGNEVMGYEFEKGWGSILSVCLVSLTVVIGLFNLCAVSINIRLPKHNKK